MCGPASSSAPDRLPGIPGGAFWLVAWIILGLRVAAQPTGGALEVPWWTVDGGGGTSAGGVYRITGTIGQFDAASVRPAGDAFTEAGGFWELLEESPATAPEIVQQPIPPPPVPPGGCTSLFVEANSSPAPQFQWRLNGINLRGATNPFLDLCLSNNLIPGLYDVLVFNPLGAVRSVPVIVRLDLQVLPFSKVFESRGLITTAQGQGAANNQAGGRLPGEPLHDGRRGGKSVWITYRAPATGILSLDTQGSSFDTLLAVYRGGSFAKFVPVASDDDNGGFYRSLVRFRVVAGEDYEVAVDGRAGESGQFQLNWDLFKTDLIPPRIARQPISLTVHPGQEAKFTATVENGAAYQWFLRGRPLRDDGRISGAQSPGLVVGKASPADAGIYRLVTTTGGIEIQSETAILQLDLSQEAGPVFPGATLFDKFADARDDLFPPGPSTLLPRRLRAGATTGGLSRGGPLLARTDDFGTSPTESVVCGFPGGASAWFYYQAGTNGLVVLDTTGSSYDTLAGVFVDLTGDPASLRPVACNDDAFAAVPTSRRIFNANAELIYAVEVDGKYGVTGTLVTQVRPVGQPVLTAKGFISPDTFEVQAAAEPGLRLVLEYTGTLGAAWTPLQTNSVPQAGTTSHTLGTSGAAAFYFRARPDYNEYPMISSP